MRSPSRRCLRTRRRLRLRIGNPQAPTHLLIIPKAHYANVGEAPAELLGVLCKAAANLAARMLPGGYRIVANTGADGGQTVEHLHLHILGGRHMGWPPG